MSQTTDDTPTGRYEVQIHHRGRYDYEVRTVYIPPAVIIRTDRLPTAAAARALAERALGILIASRHEPAVIEECGYTPPPNWLPTNRPRLS